MKAERFLPSERAAKGYYQLTTSIGDTTIPSVGDEVQVGTIEYKVEISGFKKAAEEQSKDEKSFLVQIEIEGRFEAHNCDIKTADALAPYIAPIIRELNVLAIDKVRGSLADLGYQAVRPQLGLRNLSAMIAKLELA